MKGKVVRMLIRNFLKTGDFLVTVPVGIRLTAQYNDSGNIEQVYNDLGSERPTHSLPHEVLSKLVLNKIIPSKIGIKSGTTWVKGVLYTTDIPYMSGKFPECIESALLDKFEETPKRFNFFAANVYSLATPFGGANAVKQWLLMAGFNVLPSVLVSSGITDKVLETMINNENYNFHYPLVQSYLIFRKNDVRYIDNQLAQYAVNTITRFTDDNGYVRAKIDLDFCPAGTITLDYTDIVKEKIHMGDYICLCRNKEFIYNRVIVDNKNKPLPNVINCEYCHRKIKIPKEGAVQCSNGHCGSYLQKRVNHLIKVFGLEEYPQDELRKDIKENRITCLPDVFELERYKEVQVNTSIAEVFKACILVSEIPQQDVIDKFVGKCNNDINMVNYYINHPDQILSDADIQHPYIETFVEWLKDGYNASDVQTLLGEAQIQIVEANKKYTAAPIFRNVVIYLVGKFIRGDYKEIEAILASYAAAIERKDYKNANCILIGGTGENIDAKVVKYARENDVNIWYENEFFEQYGIDEDIQAHLGN